MRRGLAAASAVALAVALSACGGKNSCDFQLQCRGFTARYQCKGPDVVLEECPATTSCVDDPATKEPACVPGWVMSGTVTYADRPQTRTGLGAPEVKPIPHALVSVVSEGLGVVVGSAYADAQGRYSVSYPPSKDVAIHLMVAAKVNPDLYDFKVNAKEGIHAVGGPTVTAAESLTVDLSVTDDFPAQGFNVYATILAGLAYLEQVVPGVKPQPLTAVFYPGNKGSYYQSDANNINLFGLAQDTDGYDDTVIMHELGHFVQDTVSQSDSQGGAHDGRPADPNLAMSEGFASYWASAARNNPYYIDTWGVGGADAWAVNLERTQYPANPNGTMSQNISEWLVAEALWDMIDQPTPDDDTMATTSFLVLTSLRSVTRAGHTDRGFAGVDLVDFLDEWFIQQGTAECAAMRGILSAKRFPYDFLAPGAPCP